MSKLAVNQVKIRVDIAWGYLFRACEAYRGEHSPARWLYEAERIREEQERAHRAMEKRFTGGRAGYRVSVSYAARAIIIGHVFRGCEMGARHKPASWAEVASVRADCALAYAVRECLTAEQIATLGSAAAVNYARDVAA